MSQKKVFDVKGYIIFSYFKLKYLLHIREYKTLHLYHDLIKGILYIL